MKILILLGVMMMSTVKVVDAQITDRKIVKTRTVNLSPDSVWWKWTTREGLLTFFGIDNNVRLSVDGPYEIFFGVEKNERIGSNGCKVLSYIPKEMLSFTWNAPPLYPDIRNSNDYTWVVIYFKPAGNNRTEVTLQHYGWRQGGDWDKVYDYFDKAWSRVLDNLEKSTHTY